MLLLIDMHSFTAYPTFFIVCPKDSFSFLSMLGKSPLSAYNTPGRSRLRPALRFPAEPFISAFSFAEAATSWLMHLFHACSGENKCLRFAQPLVFLLNMQNAAAIAAAQKNTLFTQQNTVFMYVICSPPRQLPIFCLSCSF